MSSRVGAEGEDRPLGRGAAARPIQSLKGITPLPPAVGDIIADPLAAQQLGKALFWDTQIGSDGTACASCHFHAGADVRTRNSVSPARNAGTLAFGTRNGATTRTGPNLTLEARDFPTHVLSDPANRGSDVVFDTADIIGSEGNFSGDFVSTGRPARRVSPTSVMIEPCGQTYNPYDAKSNPLGSPFHANQLIYRQVEPRHTPTTINAVFNIRQNWDGRASNQFNGVDPFGARTYSAGIPDPAVPGRTIGNPYAAGLGILVAGDGVSVPQLVQPLIANASLASQAVGPALSDFDFACASKTFVDLARKLGPLAPLSGQVVDPTDSVFSRSPDLVNALKLAGLNTTYETLIKRAFSPRYWAATGRYIVDPLSGAVSSDLVRGDSQLEHNFSLFWGLALQSYQALLISDDAPFDRGPAAMTGPALRGQALFAGRANCTACHNGPLFSAATMTSVDSKLLSAVDTRLMGDGYPALVDTGFSNTGVRPTIEDRGVGGLDPYGFDLSYARQYMWRLSKQKARAPDRFTVRSCAFMQPIADACQADDDDEEARRIFSDAVDGAFKVPTLRNVGLTPPYFHNGGQSNLKDVVRFYNRGGDRRGPLGDDTSGLKTETPFGIVNRTNLDPNIGDPGNSSANNALGLTENEMDDIVQFLLSLTDTRVACHAGVFDHPELPLVVGQRDVARAGSRTARDSVATLPATGQAGLRTCFPNSGDLFGTLNVTDKRKLPDVLGQILQLPK